MSDSFSPRHVLDDVPRVGFDGVPGRCPECVPFPSCLRACLEFLGEDFGATMLEAHGQTWRMDRLYAYLMGVTGCAFRMHWGDGWQPDNVAIHYMSDDPAAPYRRGVASVGYTCELVTKADGDARRFRQAIKDSIDAGRPVIAQGVIGPPEDCILAGYDDYGDVVIGWNFFQHQPFFRASLEFEPNGYFRKRNWYPETWSLLVLGEKATPPASMPVLRSTLAWAQQVVQTPITYGTRANGLAAYDAWIAALGRDEDFPTDDLHLLLERQGVHDDAVGMVAEGRWYAAQFVLGMAEAAPEAAEALHLAAACYVHAHDLMWQCWGILGAPGRGEAQARALADADNRAKLAMRITDARDHDAVAIDQLAKVLNLLM